MLQAVQKPVEFITVVYFCNEAGFLLVTACTLSVSGVAPLQVWVCWTGQSTRLRGRSVGHRSVSSNLAAASQLARNQRFVPVRGAERDVVRGSGGAGRSHSHVNNYRRVSNYKAPLQPADTYSSRVRAARDSFLRAAASGRVPTGALFSPSLLMAARMNSISHAYQ